MLLAPHAEAMRTIKRKPSRSDFLLPKQDARRSCSGRARSCSCAPGYRLNQERRNNRMKRTALRGAADDRLPAHFGRRAERARDVLGAVPLGMGISILMLAVSASQLGI